jgi:hypothetical protein
MNKIYPLTAVGPCRTPKYFAFGCVLITLLVLLMPNPREELDGGAREDNLPMVPVVNNVTKMDSTKPTMLIHLGPPKTATTYLQCILTNIMDTLALDNYVYLGLHNQKCKSETSSGASYFKNVYGLFAGEKMAVFSPMFLAELRNAHSQGKNAIMMDECLQLFTPEQRKLLIEELTSNWNVKLILNYRRAYELFPSLYNTIHKPKSSSTSTPYLTIWPGETNDNNVMGEPLLPFNIDEPYIERLLELIETQGLHPVSQLASNLNLEQPKHTTHILYLFPISTVGGGSAKNISTVCHSQ